MADTIKVRFSDACTDVLVWLTALDEHQWRYVEQIADAVAPADAQRPRLATSSALGTLRECGLVRFQKIDADVTWQATPEGRALVTASRADRQPPTSVAGAKGGKSAVAPGTTNHPDPVSAHEGTNEHG